MLPFRRTALRPVKIILLLIVVAVTALAHPLTVRTVGVDLWKVGDAERDLRQAQLDESRLDRECEYAREEAEVSGVLLDDLIAGRAELSAVARQRWEMSRDRSGIRQFLEENRRGPTLEAKMAHNLVVQIGEVCPQEARAAVDQRLRQQYQAAYGLAPGE